MWLETPAEPSASTLLRHPHRCLDKHGRRKSLDIMLESGAPGNAQGSIEDLSFHSFGHVS
jgi:hypothetical protein